MDIPTQVHQTIGDQMPWYGMTMDYTEKVCELIPEQLWDWRPEDPQGHFQASLGEIAMHCADERHGHAQMLSGETDNGSPGIFRVLMGVACHEAGHRGTLYTLSRLNGVSLPAEE
jgi:hypothetical protein